MISTYHDVYILENLQLFLMDCLNGGPTLITIPVNMYWKQEIRNRAVFSEFVTLDFSMFSCGGTNLANSQLQDNFKRIRLYLP